MTDDQEKKQRHRIKVLMKKAYKAQAQLQHARQYAKFMVEKLEKDGEKDNPYYTRAIRMETELMLAYHGVRDERISTAEAFGLEFEDTPEQTTTTQQNKPKD